MRGVAPKVKKQMGLEKKMNRLLFSTMIPVSAGYFASDLLAVCRTV